MILTLAMLCALFVPILAPYNPIEADLIDTLAPPSPAHWLGTDHQGRDILSRLIYGARISVAVGLLSVFVAGGVGTLIAVLSGFLRGWVDRVLMSITDGFLALPYLMVAEPLVAHQHLSWKAARQRAMELLRMVRIGAAAVRLKQYPHELSGGMRQRAASAMGLGPMPSLLIADEPTTALDVTTQRQYLDLLKEMQAATGIAIIFVTHDLSLIGTLCDQLAVFYGGSVVEAGAKEKIFAQPAHPYTEALLRALPRLGHKIDRLHSIPGEPPNVGRLPAGCPFHPRCGYALEVCRSGAPPPVFTLPDARRVRCWLRESEHGGEPPRSP